MNAHRTYLLAGAAVLACAAPPASAEPVNGRIAYSTFESGGGSAGDIWTMEPDGSGKLQAVFDPLDDAQSDWSRDGTKIAYRSRRELMGRTQYEISIVDFSVRESSGRPHITDIPRALDGTQASQPAWFPDGTGLLYRRTNAPGTARSDIWAMNVDGTNPRAVYSAPEDQFYPSFSPDMTKLLFVTVAPPSGRKIEVMDVATGTATTLFDHSVASFDSAPSWSPDGHEIAFESDLDGDPEIFIMDADGTRVRQITHNTLWDEGPSWSPDGTMLAYSSGDDDTHLDIFTMNLDGSNARRLTSYPGADESPDWGINPHPAGVGGTVPAVLSLDLSAQAGFGAFVPGVAHDYTASAAGTVTSTAGNATLSFSQPGHLMNGTYALPEALRVELSKSTWSAPVANDPVTVTFRQHIGATDALRTGAYTKRLTFTLSTTQP